MFLFFLWFEFIVGGLKEKVEKNLYWFVEELWDLCVEMRFYVDVYGRGWYRLVDEGGMV